MMQLMNMFEIFMKKANQSDLEDRKIKNSSHKSLRYDLEARDKHPIVPFPVFSESEQLTKEKL
jgi:hypothetical protein